MVCRPSSHLRCPSICRYIGLYFDLFNFQLAFLTAPFSALRDEMDGFLVILDEEKPRITKNPSISSRSAEKGAVGCPRKQNHDTRAKKWSFRVCCARENGPFSVYSYEKAILLLLRLQHTTHTLSPPPLIKNSRDI